jgi:hypothetical protein
VYHSRIRYNANMSERTAPPALDRFVAEVTGIFRDRLRAIVTYGGSIHLTAPDAPGDDGVHTLVLVDAIDASDLRACAGLAASWARRGLAVPLLLTSAELKRSLDAFPMEFAHILADHTPVIGEDPLAGFSVAPEDVRRACEGQARSHALHLRESYLECGAEPRDLARLISASAPPFRALLAAVARLHGESGPADAEALARVAAASGLDAATVRQVLDATGTRLNAADAESLFPLYLEAAERLVRHVDAWRA